MDLVAIITKWNTVELLDFLKSQELKLNDGDFVILKKTKILGLSFLYFIKDDFYENGLASGPTIAILQLIKRIKDGQYILNKFLFIGVV